MKKPPPSPRTVPQQSDIVIDPDGNVSVSFRWSDFDDETPQLKNPPLPIPELDENVEKNLNSQYQHCTMCPKQCGFNRIKAKHPRCGDHHIQVSTWGLTMGDEPEIKGQRGSGAIMLAGCPLSCPSCHNPEMVKEGQALSMNEVIELFYRLYERGAHNIQLLSPTVHLPKIKVILKTLKDNHFPLPIILKSSGIENVEELEKLDGLVDVYLPDLKFGPCSKFATRAGFPQYFTQSKYSIGEMLRQTGKPIINSEGVLTKGTMVRHVKSPIAKEESQGIQEFLRSLQGRALVSIMDNFVNFE